MQLQVTLADLVVFDVIDDEEMIDSAEYDDAVYAQPPPRGKVRTWGVRFDESGLGPIVVDDAGARMYDEQVAQQMAAAAAQVGHLGSDDRTFCLHRATLLERGKSNRSGFLRGGYVCTHDND